MTDTQASSAPSGPPDAAVAPSPALLARRRKVLAAVMGAVVVLVGAAAAIGSRELGYWTDLGPGFFPLCLGVLLMVFGSVWLLQQWRHRGDEVGTAGAATDHEAETAGGIPDPAEEYPEYSLPTVVAIVVSLCVLAATLEVIGYQLAMFLFLLFHLLVLGRRRLLLSLAIAFAGSIGVFVVFTRLLGVALPPASVPFLRDLGL